MKKFLSLLMALVMVLGVVGASAEAAAYVRAEDEDIYLEVLGAYDELMQEAKAAPTAATPATAAAPSRARTPRRWTDPRPTP